MTGRGRGGGNKRAQDRDIKTAMRLAAEWSEEKGNPTLKTTLAVMKALNIKLTAKVEKAARIARPRAA